MSKTVWVLWHHVNPPHGYPSRVNNARYVLGLFSSYEYANRALVDCISSERGGSQYSLSEWAMDDYEQEKI